MILPPPSDEILTRAEVAARPKIKPRQVERLGIPCIELGRKTKRYLAKDLLAWREAKRRLDGVQAAKAAARAVCPHCGGSLRRRGERGREQPQRLAEAGGRR